MEVWKPIKGYEGLYEVSDLGRVKSLAKVITEKTGMRKNRVERIMKPARFGNYSGVILCNGETQVKMYIHRLVALNFIENDDPKKRFVNHKDCCKENNKLSNLEWVTPLENLQHAAENKRLNMYGENSPVHKFSNQTVEEIRDLYDNQVFQQHELSNMYGVSRMQVHRIVKRKLRIKNQERIDTSEEIRISP